MKAIAGEVLGIFLDNLFLISAAAWAAIALVFRHEPSTEGVAYSVVSAYWVSAWLNQRQEKRLKAEVLDLRDRLMKSLDREIELHKELGRLP